MFDLVVLVMIGPERLRFIGDGDCPDRERPTGHVPANLKRAWIRAQHEYITLPGGRRPRWSNGRPEKISQIHLLLSVAQRLT